MLILYTKNSRMIMFIFLLLNLCIYIYSLYLCIFSIYLKYTYIIITYVLKIRKIKYQSIIKHKAVNKSQLKKYQKNILVRSFLSMSTNMFLEIT